MASDRELTAPSTQDDPPRTPHCDDPGQYDTDQDDIDQDESHQDDSHQNDPPHGLPHHNVSQEPDVAVPTTGHGHLKFNALDARLQEYFLSRSSQFRRLLLCRTEALKNPSVVKTFRQRRRSEDQDPVSRISRLFKIMEAVAMHIHEVYIAKGEPSPLMLPAGRAKMLDIGMAPGGFLQAILEINKDGPDLAVTAITLPPDQGGHENFLARSQSCEDTEIQLPTEHDSCKVIPGPRQSVHIHQFDITMLAGDLGMTEFPSSHPHRDHRETLLPAQPFLKETFDLVICGCQIVHSLDRIDGPKHIEQVRNFTSQLAIGLDHLARHGTIVVLMHNFEAWRNAHMIWLFRQLTKFVEVVKPDNGNNRFCTAYMIAQRVDTARREATQAVQRWRDEWKTAMFQTEEDYTRKYVAKDEAVVDRVLHDIGPHLQIWGQGLWRIQADAWKRYLARCH